MTAWTNFRRIKETELREHGDGVSEREDFKDVSGLSDWIDDDIIPGDKDKRERKGFMGRRMHSAWGMESLRCSWGMQVGR